MMKKKKNSGELFRLMFKTFSRRKKWVKITAPSVQEILDEYPAIKHAKVVSWLTIFWN